MARKRRGIQRRAAPTSRPSSLRSSTRGGSAGRAEPVRPRGPQAETPAAEEGPPVVEQPPDPMGETRLGDRYRLGEMLGEGSAAQVYAATDLLLGREVAVKVLRSLPDPVVQRRALRAAQAAARMQVQHRNLMPVLDVQGGRPAFLVLGLIGGRRLTDLLPARLPDEEARALADGLLSGLAALHEAGLVHRGVSAENVLVDSAGVTVLTSAGLTEAAEDPGLGLRPTEGTSRRDRQAPSPEQDMGLAATPQSDVHGAALVIRSLLPSETRAVTAVLERALKEDPQERYPDALAFRTALREVLSAGGEPPPMPVEQAPAVRGRGGGRRLAALVALGCLLPAIAAFLILRDPPRSADPAPAATATGTAEPTPQETISDETLADIVAEAEQNPAVLGVGGRTLLPGLAELGQLEGEERGAAVAGLYGATIVGTARGSVDPGFADRVIEALWPEVTVESLVALIAQNPEAAGERGPTLLGALRDLVSISDVDDRLTRGADLGLVAAEWAQQRTLSPSVGVTAVTALNGAQGGDAQTTESTVGVPASQEFTDTGIEVPAGGIVIVVASGEVFHDEGSSAGPDGTVNAPELRSFNLIPQVDHAALIGRMGQDGDPFFVGTDSVFPVAQAGRLFLGVNDEGVDDNRGAFEATVTVWGS